MTIIQNKTRPQVWKMFPNAHAVVPHRGAFLVLFSAADVKLWEQGKLVSRR